MESKLDAAKAELLEKAAVAAAEQRSDHSGEQPSEQLDEHASQVLLRRYYRHAAPEDLVDRDPVDILGAALSHRRLAARRPQGTASVRVFTPSRDRDGWACKGTVVEVVTDDMPYLVASVTAEISRAGYPIRVVIHPQLNVRRELTGELTEICDVTDPAYAPTDSIHESWIHVEIDRLPQEPEDSSQQELETNLLRVLRDVRDVHEDWQKMRMRALGIADELAGATSGGLASVLPHEEIADVRDLLRWLTDDHFTFLGYREYELADDNGQEVLRAQPGTGLGILRADEPISRGFSRLTPQGRKKAHEPRLLVLTKANSRSTVQRRAYLDYVGIKKFDENGEVVGERRFLGLFTAEAYTEGVQQIPLLRRRVKQVMSVFGFDPMSYSGKDLLQILETYPREELFQISPEDLVDVTRAVMHLQERRRVKLFLRKEDYGRYYSALVYVPRDRYDTEVRLRMQDILLSQLRGTAIDYTIRHTESVLSRVHFVIRVAAGTEIAPPDQDAIEQMLAAATRTWSDDFTDALTAEFGEERAAGLARRYENAFPESYKVDFGPAVAVADVRQLEDLLQASTPDPFSVHLYEPHGAAPGEHRLRIYRLGRAVSLSEVLPVLQRMGMDVVDEHPYELSGLLSGDAGSQSVWLYDFGLRGTVGETGLDEAAKARFCDALAAVWTGRAENDRFNALVPWAGLTWREASVLRGYGRYLRQGGLTFSLPYVEAVLLDNRTVARLLVRLFEARLDPHYQSGASELVDGLVEEINGALDAVASLDEDRILRALLAVIQATLRTNYFQKSDGEPKPYISFKLDPQGVPDLPLPRPRYEIWVYSPRVEGVHLRFGKVARGGLRWSDRREDFRTEVLGLVKAQMVKNSVIVPVGAKGGFVAKRLPDPSADREAWLAEGIDCYKTFIRGLLDITDNLVTDDSGHTTVLPPPEVVRHDGDDTYMVVAADKGTATFSDIANGVAKEYGFWLGDAFASGGSAGYDHKKMGITARGAWVSVERHFRELGVNTRTQDFTVIGIGDMSGDVFGNGMLLSEHIRLVAAFDHRHIFVDPNPDAAASFAERRRLFELPRSSWADYDTRLISAGGGVFRRGAKSIPVTPQMRAALGIAAEVARMTPAELMRAILLAPVDLFWNGGIGTYVKSASETHADVGDKANDAIRVNGADLRVRVIGEGGNLGLTQLGRIEYSRFGCGGEGGRVNNDAVDNSAGVDTSDHEVNIKILLDRVVAGGELTQADRDRLLDETGDEVARLVLRNNYGQNVALASSVAQAPSLLHVHARYMRRLVRERYLNRALEFLPADRQIAERRQAGVGLTQPEFCVLLAYTKITLADELLASDLPEDPYLREQLYDYFPRVLRDRYRAQMDTHPLRREIITTQVVNNIVNNAGTTFMFRLREETGASAEEVARAHTVARVVFDMQRYWSESDGLDNEVPADVQTRVRLEGRKLTERASRWFINNRHHPMDVAAQVDAFAPGVAAVTAKLPELVSGVYAERLERVRDELIDSGVPAGLATTAAAMGVAYAALDMVEVAQDSGRNVLEVAAVYFYVADQLDIAKLLERITALPRDDRWSSVARAALRDDLYATHAGLTFDVLAAGPAGASPAELFTAWSERNQAVVSRARQVLDDIDASDSFDLATLSVALRITRTMLRTSMSA